MAKQEKAGLASTLALKSWLLIFHPTVSILTSSERNQQLATIHSF